MLRLKKKKTKKKKKDSKQIVKPVKIQRMKSSTEKAIAVIEKPPRPQEPNVPVKRMQRPDRIPSTRRSSKREESSETVVKSVTQVVVEPTAAIERVLAQVVTLELNIKRSSTIDVDE
jgi:hypothetical protein